MPKKNDNQNNEIETLLHRLNYLESNQKQSHDFFKHTLTAITIIFLFVSVVITVLSIISKKDVDNAIKDMEHKFEVLSGQALEKPKLIATYEGVPLNENEVINVREYEQLSIPLHKIRIINNSKKPTSDLKVVIHFSKKIRQITEKSGNGNIYRGAWDIEKSPLNEFSSSATYLKQFKLNPTEIWTRPYLLQFNSEENQVTPLKAKLIVYYGDEDPLELYFNLSVDNGK